MGFQAQKIFFSAIFIVFLISGYGSAETGIKEFFGNEIEELKLSTHEDLFDGFIYFADTQKTVLKSVEKRFPSTLDSHQLGTQIIETLIEGPPSSGYSSIWPRDTKINALYISDDGKAFVDLTPGQGINQTMDTGIEVLAVYSVVNSLMINIPKIKMIFDTVLTYRCQENIPCKTRRGLIKSVFEPPC